MKNILYLERKLDDFVSIENVFRQVARNLSKLVFRTSFQKLQYGNSFFGIVKNLLSFKKSGADIYHITGHIHYMSLVLPGMKTVLTIHDLRFLQTKKKLRRFVLRKLFLDLPLRRLKYVTTISETTKRELIAVTKCKEDRIRVIENPLGDIFVLSDDDREFNSSCPTILQIGTMENKNLPNLVKAIGEIRCKLIIVGKLDEKQSGQLRAAGVVFENKCNLSDLEIRSEYQNADLVTFCSTYEGFGLPIIESQAMRRPVITSNLSPMKEVSGGAAYLADPDDFLSIRKGILKIVNDKNYRENLVAEGIANVKRFDSRAIATQYEMLYDEILSERG